MHVHAMILINVSLYLPLQTPRRPGTFPPTIFGEGEENAREWKIRLQSGEGWSGRSLESNFFVLVAFKYVWDCTLCMGIILQKNYFQNLSLVM